ncbi:MAG: N-acetylmuramoyl-L-alanine amidase [Verrucomicrobiales bacterium]|nr:N-acetylmuramoyl-L-alanine amidase [Verrucomicrobiales bacterium]
MNCARKLLLFFAVLIASSFASAADFTTVVIDAGHGGHDLGAAESKVYEKHINLDVSRRLERTLRENGLKVVMVRSKDNYVTLSERASIANKYRNSIFVSIHFNHSWKNTVSGIETYYYGSKGSPLAKCVQDQLIEGVQAVDRGVKKASFAVLRRTSAPACLVEGGFVSNAIERDAMMEGKRRQIIADSIAKGILNYKNR